VTAVAQRFQRPLAAGGNISWCCPFASHAASSRRMWLEPSGDSGVRSAADLN